MRVSTSLEAFGEFIKMQPGLLEVGWDVVGLLAHSFWTICCRKDSHLTQRGENAITLVFFEYLMLYQYPKKNRMEAQKGKAVGLGKQAHRDTSS